MSDIKDNISNAEDLLRQATDSTGDQAKELYEKACSCLKQAKDEATRAKIILVEKSKKIADAAENYMSNYPLKSIGISACIGILIGVLINRK
ncbi:MAG: DUF883 family protein [Burkholderia sp.]|nr:DUF883 family protein [Burkholderia sp.]